MTSRTSYGLRRSAADDAVDLLRVVQRILRRSHVERQLLAGRQRRGDGSADAQRVIIILGEVVGHAGMTRVDVGAAKFLGRDVFAGRGFDERRAAQEDRPRPVHDDRLVRHRRARRRRRRCRSP